MDKFAFNMALEEIWIVVRRANKYIDEKAPWVLAKTADTDPAAKASFGHGSAQPRRGNPHHLDSDLPVHAHDFQGNPQADGALVRGCGMGRCV